MKEMLFFGIICIQWAGVMKLIELIRKSFQ